MFLSKNANRKEKRKFNKEFSKLPEETKHEVLQAELMDKLSPAMNKAITEAMISGINLAFEQLYEDFVSKIDSSVTVEGAKILQDELLSAIRKRYVEIQAKKAKDESEKEGESE